MIGVTLPKEPFVSIHAPTWGATELCKLLLSVLLVSIHAPTWGATVNDLGLVFANGVSIHAPTWGATFTLMHNEALSKVSIHAPTWGATPFALTKALFVSEFQSTLPRGERQCLRYAPAKKNYVSIHAPTWGATLFSLTFSKYVDVSIHAPTWGATFATGCRNISYCSFNPRSHVGSDLHSLLFSFTMSYNTIFAKEPYITINYTVILTMSCLIC